MSGDIIDRLRKGIERFRNGPKPTKEALRAAHPEWSEEHLERSYTYRLMIWAPENYGGHER